MSCKECIHYKACKFTYIEAFGSFNEEQFGQTGCAEFEEAKRGEWIYHECVSSHEGAISGYSCSACSIFVDEDVFDTDSFHKEFCGHCGAKMDERKGE